MLISTYCWGLLIERTVSRDIHKHMCGLTGSSTYNLLAFIILSPPRQEPCWGSLSLTGLSDVTIQRGSFREILCQSCSLVCNVGRTPYNLLSLTQSVIKIQHKQDCQPYLSLSTSTVFQPASLSLFKVWFSIPQPLFHPPVKISPSHCRVHCEQLL